MKQKQNSINSVWNNVPWWCWFHLLGKQVITEVEGLVWKKKNQQIKNPQKPLFFLTETGKSSWTYGAAISALILYCMSTVCNGKQTKFFHYFGYLTFHCWIREVILNLRNWKFTSDIKNVYSEYLKKRMSRMFDFRNWNDRHPQYSYCMCFKSLKYYFASNIWALNFGYPEASINIVYDIIYLCCS